MNKAELGEKLRAARKECGYTQERLAEMAGIGTVYLGEIERGKKMPSLNTFHSRSEKNRRGDYENVKNTVSYYTILPLSIFYSIFSRQYIKNVLKADG